MSNPRKIIGNPTSADLLLQMQAFETLESLYKAFPFARKLFPGIENAFADLSEIKKQAEILRIPDQFNECFASLDCIRIHEL